ncbi:hypothetical protein [Streptomyces luteolus]|uniref:Uncharacterized protein n=1 Tax=Streptomyces luteolus TaxID=3043615 RepID=A0ABT6SWC4_9ACTN|nr:hypothetical protein [Streptomyces sp. B-S-A12]MDI3419895.1 hypothetical protein [Streptomyces sp. B-S-A12]
MAQLNGRLDKVVPMDVYTVEKNQITARVDALEAAREKDADKVTNTRRWMLGTVLTVIIALLPYLTAMVKGAGA